MFLSNQRALVVLERADARFELNPDVEAKEEFVVVDDENSAYANMEHFAFADGIVVDDGGLVENDDVLA